MRSSACICTGLGYSEATHTHTHTCAQDALALAVHLCLLGEGFEAAPPAVGRGNAFNNAKPVADGNGSGNGGNGGRPHAPPPDWNADPEDVSFAYDRWPDGGSVEVCV
jgi:hypothetical protein